MPSAVNPGLTVLCVLLILALVLAIVTLSVMLHRARAQCLHAVAEARHRGRQHKGAQERAAEAERRGGEAEGHARRLFELLQGAQATLREAVTHEDQLMIIARHTGELLALHEHVPPGADVTFTELPDERLPPDPLAGYPVDDAAQRGYPVQPPPVRHPWQNQQPWRNPRQP
jgi:hypothetical protein